MALNRLKAQTQRPEEQTIGLYEEMQQKRTTNRAEQLFDSLIGTNNEKKKCENYSNRRRQPLGTIAGNVLSKPKPKPFDPSIDDNSESDKDFEPSAKTPKTKVNKTKGKNKVRFADSLEKRVNKKTQNKRNVSKKCKDYPDCTKEALLKAFESAGLPDYDEIARYELHVTKVVGNDRPDPPTPPMHEIMKPFEDLIDWKTEFSKRENPLNESPNDVSLDSVENSNEMNALIEDKTEQTVSDSQQNNVWADCDIDSVQNQCQKSISNNESIDKTCDRNESKTNYKRESITTAALGASRIASTPVLRRHNVTLRNVSPIQSIDSPEKPNESQHTFVAPIPPLRTRNRKVLKASSTQTNSRVDIVEPTLNDLQKVTTNDNTKGENRLKVVTRSLIDEPNPCIDCDNSENSSDESNTLVERTISKDQSISENTVITNVTAIGRSYNTQKLRNRTLRKNISNELSSDFEPMVKSTPLVTNRQKELKHSKFDLVVDKTHFDVSLYKFCRSHSESLLHGFPITTTTIVPVVADIERGNKSTKLSKSKGTNAYHLYRKSIASVHSIYNKTSQPFRTVVRTSNQIGVKSLDESNETIKSGLSNRKDLKHCIDNSLSETIFSSSKVVFANGKQRVLSAKEKVLLLCEPNEVIDFKCAFEDCVLKSCRKIGEGSYGEVYASKDKSGADIVIKIIPLVMNDSASEEELFAQILPELVISQTFNRLKSDLLSNRAPNFIDMIKATTTRGLFPNKLIQEWNEFKKRKGTENEDPMSYNKNQLYIVLQLANGGQDLETFKFKSALEAFSVFIQLSLSLAAAELEYEFEHRDMHWGNVLISTTTISELNYIINGVNYSVNTKGMFASLIDFSLSRMSSEGFIIFDDLAKYSDLFEGQGDYQFDVYRNMKELNANDWQQFKPKTNIFWLHYMLDKVINAKKYSSNRTNLHKNAINLLKQISANILNYNSATDLVESEEFADYLSHLK